MASVVSYFYPFYKFYLAISNGICCSSGKIVMYDIWLISWIYCSSEATRESSNKWDTDNPLLNPALSAANLIVDSFAFFTEKVVAIICKPTSPTCSHFNASHSSSKRLGWHILLKKPYQLKWETIVKPPFSHSCQRPWKSVFDLGQSGFNSGHSTEMSLLSVTATLKMAWALTQSSKTQAIYNPACSWPFLQVCRCMVKLHQMAQNTEARMVFNQPRWAHVSPLLIVHHWLPACIKFKSLMLT